MSEGFPSLGEHRVEYFEVIPFQVQIDTKICSFIGKGKRRKFEEQFWLLSSCGKSITNDLLISFTP